MDSTERVHYDLGGWISGPCLSSADATCRSCGTQIFLSSDGLYHSREYPDLGGYCPDADDDKHMP